MSAAPSLTVRGPQAGGAPIRLETAEAAAEWLTVLMEGAATDAQRQDWQRWLDADPEHERAWRHIEVVAARLQGLHGPAASLSLASTAWQPSRRAALKAVLALLVTGGGSALVMHTPAWRQWRADYASATGSRREVALADGSRLVLNSGSAIAVDFNGERRLLRLLQGEAMIVTGHQGASLPPFIVETAEGRIRALGTRFDVRHLDGRSRVGVLASAVELAPRDGAAPVVLQAGSTADFTRAAVGPPAALDPARHAWLRGQLIADDMRLADFLAELDRYRPGVLHCTAAVANLRVSGAFPLDDTNRILAMLPNVLPVQVRARTQYWITVEARH